MPNLSKFVEQGGYSPLEECSPPQTEVSWTSIATGVDPGSHGIFDFVHRDPQTYIPYVSLLPTRQTMVGEQFLPPYTTKTLFHEAAEMGFPATALWWPALFPARPDVPVATIPGLGTPDIRGQIGVGTYLTTEPRELKKTRVIKLESSGKGRFAAALEGPQVKTKEGLRPATASVHSGCHRRRLGQAYPGRPEARTPARAVEPGLRDQVQGRLCLHGACRHAGHPHGAERSRQPVLRPAADPSAALAVALRHAPGHGQGCLEGQRRLPDARLAAGYQRTRRWLHQRRAVHRPVRLHLHVAPEDLL